MKMKIKLTLLEEMLGTKPANPLVFDSFIATQAPDPKSTREEIEKAKERRAELEFANNREEAGSTVFHSEDGKPGIYDYHIKGFFKEACGSLRIADGMKSAELKAYKTKIDGLIFVQPRFIPISLPPGLSPGSCERPLRGQTAQGPRVTVVRSETVPAGSTLQFEIVLLADSLAPLIREWLAYGQLRGLGQWRNSGKGRFDVEELP